MEEKTVIREALPADAPALARLNRTAMGYDYPEDQTADRLAAILQDSRCKIFMAESAGQVAGYLHLEDYQLLYADPMKNIMGIAVDPNRRRQGLGRALLEAGEAWAREQAPGTTARPCGCGSCGLAAPSPSGGSWRRPSPTSPPCCA